MDVHHVMFRSLTWKKECILLRQEHETQVSPWPSTVKQLLRSWKATPAVLKFLATTRAERRPRAQEQEQTERRRRRDETWLLGKDRLEGGEDQEKEKNRELVGNEDKEREEVRGR